MILLVLVLVKFPVLVRIREKGTHPVLSHIILLLLELDVDLLLKLGNLL
uniref:Uncharacterized protein n=1 Tax=Arundo donax TaxID=35708 RepID=A0A0A9DUF3_ARUDO